MEYSCLLQHNAALLHLRHKMKVNYVDCSILGILHVGRLRETYTFLLNFKC